MASSISADLDERIAAIVRRTTTDQGFGPQVTDPAILRQVARLVMGGDR